MFLLWFNIQTLVLLSFSIPAVMNEYRCVLPTAQNKRKYVADVEDGCMSPIHCGHSSRHAVMKPNYGLERLVLLVQGSRVRRVYVLTLVALTSVTWTCLVAMLFTVGVLAPFETSRDCGGTGRNNTFTTCLPDITKSSGPSGYHQRLFAPRDVATAPSKPSSVPVKVILLWTKYYGKKWRIPTGGKIFEDLQCQQRRCAVTDERQRVRESDALLVHMRDISDPSELPAFRRPDQRWIFYLLESPYHTKVNLTKFNGVFNWTSTYSYDSDIPSPYGSFTQSNTLKDTAGPGRPPTPSTKKSFATKTRLAAWFVTNCKSRNQRESYVKTMQSHMMVDVYGICGKLKCRERDLCLDMLRRKYKFYLAFENSNCRQYITEKFWHNALDNDVVPVVMGAPKEDYERVAPPNSFIHVDDFPSARELSRYLRLLHKDTKLYSNYFTWKETGESRTQINEHPTLSQFWCHLCYALHDRSLPPKVHERIDKWWSVPNQCF